MKKLLFTFFLILAVKTISFNQSHVLLDSSSRQRLEISDPLQAPPTTRIETGAENELELIKLEVSLLTISLDTKKLIPINNGEVWSTPTAEKKSSDLTDEKGIGHLELVPGIYTVSGMAPGYEKATSPKINKSTPVKIIIYPTKSFESEFIGLKNLIENGQLESAKATLELLKSKYPNNKDLLLLEKKAFEK